MKNNNLKILNSLKKENDTGASSKQAPHNHALDASSHKRSVVATICTIAICLFLLLPGLMQDHEKAVQSAAHRTSSSDVPSLSAKDFDTYAPSAAQQQRSALYDAQHLNSNAAGKGAGGSAAKGSAAASGSAGAAGASASSASAPPADATASAGQVPSEFDPQRDRNFFRYLGHADISAALDLAPGEIRYSALDSLGRTGSAYALLTHENLDVGKRPRENISAIHPSGWRNNQRVEITFNDKNNTVYHGYFYNRSHLIAHFLGGDDKAYNMVTGTRVQNVGDNRGYGGMAGPESMARSYFNKNPDGALYYLVTPLYVGDELVPRSVIVNMQSADGHLSRKLEVFNVAPGFTIDYKTGNFWKN